ncbi:hypothetical protein [Paenibacillus oleatilyticus]|uniref:hypothetical protein n=1 Tax=Paenibacillus oleatilyticus TaxID=2594886 RepID=UPI001C1FAAF8|nr:hypothetical protein [Paenibacillus oleatilyticus]MBU7314206.1 hypothetical protein [Paenibacillus oleatilyticus]
MRTTKRIQAGPAPSMPGHLRFAEQITRKYGFASRNYLGPQALTLLEAGEGGFPVQHVSLVQFTLHLKMQLQLLKQEERDMLRTYRRTLHLLEKLARRHDASERKTSSFLPTGVGTASRITAANSATGTMRADRRQESKALRSNVGEMERAVGSTPLGAHRHPQTNGEAAGSRNSADIGIRQSVSAGLMVHSSGRIRGRGMREPLVLRRDYRFAERSGRGYNLSGERARHVPVDQVRQARRKPESKAMAALRNPDAAAEIKERRDERQRGLQQGSSSGESSRSPLLEREWRKPEQEQGRAFGQVLEWKRISLRQQAFNPIHIDRTTQFYSVMADDVLSQHISESQGLHLRGRLEKASSPVDSDDKKGYRTVSESRGGRTVVRPIIVAASPIDDDDKRNRTLGGNAGQSAGWKKRGTASVTERSWLRPKGVSSLGMEILLQRRIGLFEAGSLGGHRTLDARLEKKRMTGSRQTDAAAAASEGRLFVLGRLRMDGPAKSMRDISDRRYETAVLSSTTTVFERTHWQKVNADLFYGRAPIIVQRKIGNESSVSLRFHYPMSASLRRDNVFISQSPGRSSNKFGGISSLQMLVGVVPSTGISAFEYDSSVHSYGSVPLHSRMLMSSEQLYHSRIAEAESGEMTADLAVPVRHERTGLVTVQPKPVAVKTGNPMTSLSGVNSNSPIVSAKRSSAVEGRQLQRHPLPFGGRAVSIGTQIYAANSIGAVKQRYVRRHQASQSNSAPTRGKNARHDANDTVSGFTSEAVRSFTTRTVSGSANPMIRRFIRGAGSSLVDIVLRSTSDEIRESEGWGWNLTDVRRHPVVPAQYEQSRFLSVHSFILHKLVSLRSEGGLRALLPNVTDFAGNIGGSRIALRDGDAEERAMRRHPAGPDATLFKRNSAVYPSASVGSMAPTAPVPQFRVVPSQHAKAGQATVFGPPFVQALPDPSTRMAAAIANKLPQVRADWSSAATASVLGIFPPRASQRPLELYPSRADTQRLSVVRTNASGVLSSGSLQRPLQMHTSQANEQRLSAMPANASGVLSPGSPLPALQMHPSQADVQRLSAMLANASGVLSPGVPQRSLQLHPLQADAHRSPAMPASVLGTQPPQAASLPLQLHRQQAVAPRSPAVPASASAEGALTPRVALQMRTAQQHAKAAVTPSPSYRAARSEIEYHKKQKPDTGTLAKQAAAQAVTQVSAQLEAMKIELSAASQTALPDLDRFVDQVYRELENKIKFERQRSGL